MAVADCVDDGTIPADEADDIFICVGVFIHWQAADDKKIQDYNYQAIKESIKRAVAGSPTAAEVVAKKGSLAHPFAPNVTGASAQQRADRVTWSAFCSDFAASGRSGRLPRVYRRPGAMPAPISCSTVALPARAAPGLPRPGAR